MGYLKERPLKDFFCKRPRDSHKGDYGHLLVIAGSTGLTGAAYLAAQAALLTGSGLVTCAIPKKVNTILARKFTEVMTLPVEDDGKGRFTGASSKRILEFSKKADIAAIGPGISQAAGTRSLVLKLLMRLDIPIVLDADGLNCIALNTGILKKAKCPVIVTPHPGEMSRLIRKKTSYIQKNRTETAEAFSAEFNVITVLKGTRTIVAEKGRRKYVNKTGNPGMASGGCGDILTGMIASLAGQGLSGFDAAKLGVYLHGLAGDITARQKGETSLVATDLLGNIPHAIKAAKKRFDKKNYIL